MEAHKRLDLLKTTVIPYINKIVEIVSNSGNEICNYCQNRRVWLSAVHIHEKENNTADYMSKLLKPLNEDYSQRLSKNIFLQNTY